MDENLEKSVLGFEKLWARVNAGEPEREKDKRPGKACADKLREFMEGEALATAFYTALADSFTGHCRAALLRTAAEEAGHLKKLQTEYFLLTGDSYAPAGGQTEPPAGVMSALREAWQTELNVADGYMAASKSPDCPGIEALFSELASDETRHAGLMKQLVAKAME